MWPHSHVLLSSPFIATERIVQQLKSRIFICGQIQVRVSSNPTICEHHLDLNDTFWNLLQYFQFGRHLFQLSQVNLSLMHKNKVQQIHLVTKKKKKLLNSCLSASSSKFYLHTWKERKTLKNPFPHITELMMKLGCSKHIFLLQDRKNKKQIVFQEKLNLWNILSKLWGKCISFYQFENIIPLDVYLRSEDS